MGFYPELRLQHLPCNCNNCPLSMDYPCIALCRWSLQKIEWDGLKELRLPLANEALKETRDYYKKKTVTIVTPVGDGGDGDAALEELVIHVSAENRRGHESTVTPTHDRHL